MSGGAAVLDVAIDARLEHGARVLVVHGAAEAEARVGWLGGRFHQLRCAEPLSRARARRRREIRRLGDDELLGEATVLDPPRRRHGPTNDALVRLVALERGERAARRRVDRAAAAGRRGARAGAALRRGRRAAAGDADLTPAERAALFALREAGRVVLLERGRHVHVDHAAQLGS